MPNFQRSNFRTQDGGRVNVILAHEEYLFDMAVVAAAQDARNSGWSQCARGTYSSAAPRDAQGRTQGYAAVALVRVLDVLPTCFGTYR